MMPDREEPQPIRPDVEEPLASLFQRVERAIYALPSFFESPLHVAGILATDLFTFNSSLAATIEYQVVLELNRMRSTWDPDDEFTTFRFKRQPQNFPDVVLESALADQPVLGIELKSWYALAKEREPSFRFRVSPNACAPQDLLVVVPWALSNVLSGSPVILDPFVTQARYAAEYRNWHWEHQRSAKGDPRIDLSEFTGAYPSKVDEISDRPKSDAGGNFGRISRTGLMDGYIESTLETELLGIPIREWQTFFISASSPG